MVFQYTFKPIEFHRVYTDLIYGSPRLKIVIITCVFFFCFGMAIGNILLSVSPSFQVTWDKYGWVLYLILSLPIIVSGYQSAFVKGVADYIFRSVTWDGADVVINLNEDGYSIETKSTLRTVKWKGVDTIKENEKDIVFGSHQFIVLQLNKSQLPKETISQIRAYLRNVQVARKELL
jgi:hypothetical protein